MSPYKSLIHRNIGKTTDSMDFEIEYVLKKSVFLFALPVI